MSKILGFKIACKRIIQVSGSNEVVTYQTGIVNSTINVMSRNDTMKGASRRTSTPNDLNKKS